MSKKPEEVWKTFGYGRVESQPELDDPFYQAIYKDLEKGGVYIFYEGGIGIVKYVGESNDMKRRIREHEGFTGGSDTLNRYLKDNLYGGNVRVAYIGIDDEEERKNNECNLIEYFDDGEGTLINEQGGCNCDAGRTVDIPLLKDEELEPVTEVVAKDLDEFDENEELVPVSGNLIGPDGKLIDAKQKGKYIPKKLAKRLDGVTCNMYLRNNQIVIIIPTRLMDGL